MSGEHVACRGDKHAGMPNPGLEEYGGLGRPWLACCVGVGNGAAAWAASLRTRCVPGDSHS